MGLYLLTPVLRIVVKNASWSLLRYLLVIWFVGTAFIPLLTLLTPFTFDTNIFSFTGWIGYFILGAYLVHFRLRHVFLWLAYALALLWTFFGTYLVAATFGIRQSQFYFVDAANFNVIIASSSIFLLMAGFSAKNIEARHLYVNGVIKAIGQNTLPIFLFHVIVLDALQKGFLGFKISLTTINPLVEIPLATTVTLLICLAVILPLKKIPHVKRIIG